MLNTSQRIRLRTPAAATNHQLEIYIKTALAALIHDLSQGLTNCPSTCRIFQLNLSLGINVPYLSIVFLLLGAIFYRTAILRRVVPLLGTLWLVLVAVMQLVYDKIEVKTVSADKYKHWNYL